MFQLYYYYTCCPDSMLFKKCQFFLAISPGTVLRNFNNYNKNVLCVWTIVKSVGPIGPVPHVKLVYMFSPLLYNSNVSLENCPSNFSNVPLNVDEWDRMSPLYPDLD